jgi:hypothetical protein
MAQRLVVSEFPNDNPELHDGLVWAAPTPCAPALPTLRLRQSPPVRVLRPDWEPRSEPRASAVPLVPPAPEESATEESATEESATEESATEESAPAEMAPDETALAETVPVETAPVEMAPVETAPVEMAPVETAPVEATESGFEAFVGALSGILIERGATRAAANVGALLGQRRLGRDAFDAGTRKVLVARGLVDGKTGRPTPEFSVVAHAWREVLDGSSGDLSACGNTTLDVWGADLLCALLGARERSDELRRALRQRGVAAFGMLAAA